MQLSSCASVGSREILIRNKSTPVKINQSKESSTQRISWRLSCIAVEMLHLFAYLIYAHSRPGMFKSLLSVRQTHRVNQSIKHYRFEERLTQNATKNVKRTNSIPHSLAFTSLADALASLLTTTSPLLSLFPKKITSTVRSSLGMSVKKVFEIRGRGKLPVSPGVRRR